MELEEKATEEDLRMDQWKRINLLIEKSKYSIHQEMDQIKSKQIKTNQHQHQHQINMNIFVQQIFFSFK